MPLPILKNLGSIGRFEIERVDGAWIRKNVDPDFTNFGQHHWFKFIPQYKIWLDQEKTPDEEIYFITNAIVQHRLMAVGKSYEEALKQANEVERKERGKKLVNARKPLPENLLDEIELDSLGSRGVVHVKLVNGKVIRDKVDQNFTEGGHDLVYSYIPDKTIWLDNDLMPQDAAPTLLHETDEREEMEKGKAYSEAHRHALEVEWKSRHQYTL